MKRNRKESPEISAGSMADVAFLLLIFFLVATTIDVDKGIVVKLPPWCEGPDCSVDAPTSGVYSVLVNQSDQLLVEGELMEVEQLRSNAKTFIRQRNEQHNKTAIVSLVNDRSTTYNRYMGVYNELRAAYNEIWKEEAQTRHGTAYEKLDSDEKLAIRGDFPLIISEAEPTDFAVK